MEDGAGGQDPKHGNGGVPLRAEQHGDDLGSAQHHQDARGYGQQRRDLHAVQIHGAETVDTFLAFGHRGKQHPLQHDAETVRRPGHAQCLGVVSQRRRAEAVCDGEAGAVSGDRGHQGGDGEPRAEPEQLRGCTPRERRAQGRRPAGDDHRREQRAAREKPAHQRPGAKSLHRQRDRDQPWPAACDTRLASMSRPKRSWRRSRCWETSPRPVMTKTLTARRESPAPRGRRRTDRPPGTRTTPPRSVRRRGLPTGRSRSRRAARSVRGAA